MTSLSSPSPWICLLATTSSLPPSPNSNPRHPLTPSLLFPTWTCSDRPGASKSFLLYHHRRFPFRASCLDRGDGEGVESTISGDNAVDRDGVDREILFRKDNVNKSRGTSFLVKLGVAVGLAVIFTILSVVIKQNSSGPSFAFQILRDNPSSSAEATHIGFSFKLFGYRIFLPESAPGYVYFWLLMAAGCGLFVSEEALNIWVGISLARMLSLDGSWQLFVESFSKNAPQILSTIFWVYWGVCISDMIPFYLGWFFNQSGASQDVSAKLGIGKEKALSIARLVQKYGNLIGFVERFSIGVRNPTAFLAGALGISPEFFFAGVCCGGLITLSIQLALGLLLRERPLFALASVATAVGIWTVIPYAAAACTALFIYLQRRYSTRSQSS
ncbi:hypothetical protein MLD38_028205 [Melastoma candidum]|uniref:Uncharacterized protein n=1 Tax=Melastoma candidum TaxID=119954 RepID=A0ACB9N6D0_9MYRT|nr:hypothetical protein MLD38_028205 [Melastoma candidum]